MQKDDEHSTRGSANGESQSLNEERCSSNYAAEEGNDRRRKAEVGLDAPIMSPASR